MNEATGAEALPLRPLVRAFFSRPALQVARDLIGCILVHDAPDGRCSGMIVETEAYAADDPASHAYRGQTLRNAPMFGQAGHAYVYLAYGMHHCLNAVTDRVGIAGAVLLRAAQPIEGVALMRARRATTKDRDLARGPGRLAQAFGVGRDHNGADLCASTLFLCAGERLPDEAILAGPRIGIGRTQDGRPWRFRVAESPWVSSGPTEPTG